MNQFRFPRRVVPAEPKVHFHLFGQVLFDDLATLQRRLVYEAGSKDDGAISVLLCEHEPLITCGRSSLRSHILLDADELAQQKLEIAYVNRGGGCILHGAGQLAIAIVAPLARLHWSVGNYLQRLQIGVAMALEKCGVQSDPLPHHFGLWGQSGLLAAFGVSVRHGITSFGAYLNVHPEIENFARIETAAHDSERFMGSLLLESPAAGRMSVVRASLIESLATAFQSACTLVYTGHPLLPADPKFARELAA